MTRDHVLLCTIRGPTGRTYCLNNKKKDGVTGQMQYFGEDAIKREREKERVREREREREREEEEKEKRSLMTKQKISGEKLQFKHDLEPKSRQE